MEDNKLSRAINNCKEEIKALVCLYRHAEYDHKSAIITICNLLEQLLSDFSKKTDRPYRYRHGKTMQELALCAMDEYGTYLNVPESKFTELQAICDKDDFYAYVNEVTLLYYTNAIAYTLFSGFIYKGRIKNEEITFIMDSDSYPESFCKFMRFSQSILLNEDPLYPGPNGGILKMLSEKNEVNERNEMNFIRYLAQLCRYLEGNCVK